jgi:hypothetical protein
MRAPISHGKSDTRKAPAAFPNDTPNKLRQSANRPSIISVSEAAGRSLPYRSVAFFTYTRHRFHLAEATANPSVTGTVVIN